MSQADLLDGIDTQQDRRGDGAARRAMIDSQLRPNDVNDKVLLAAIAKVDREDYLPEDRRSVAYRDRAIPLGEGRFAPAPTVLFKLIDRARVQAGERALVVGPNGDYAAAVLAELGLSVVALDTVSSLGPARDGVETSKGALERGFGADDSFDLILLTGAIERVSDALVAQLKQDGRIAAPAIEGGVSRLAIGRKVDGQISFRSFADAQVARLAAFDAPQGFTF